MDILKYVKRNKKFEPGPDTLRLIDRLQLSLGECFTPGLVGKKQPGYLSKTKKVAVLPENVYPPYKPALSEIEKKELVRIEQYIGILGGTLVEYDVYEKTIKALEKDKHEYRILINKNLEMPLIICTKYANIIIAPMIPKGGFDAFPLPEKPREKTKNKQIKCQPFQKRS
jgi:hypothetical protein